MVGVGLTVPVPGVEGLRNWTPDWAMSWSFKQLCSEDSKGLGRVQRDIINARDPSHVKEVLLVSLVCLGLAMVGNRSDSCRLPDACFKFEGQFLFPGRVLVCS